MELEVTDRPHESDVRVVVEGLIEYNESCAEPEHWRRLTVLARDARGRIRGGLLGYTHWRWLYIAQLWVDQEVRGEGLGTELMRRAEAEARGRGCLHAHLDTHTFQARPFYEALGYVVYAELEDYPPGHTRYSLKRELSTG